MSDLEKGLDSNAQKGLSLAATVFAWSLAIGIILGFLDGLFDIISNNIIYGHPTDEQTLLFSQKSLYLVYSMTLSGLFYGALGLIFGLALSLYSALWRRSINNSQLLLLSSWLLFSFIVLKTEVIAFRGLLASTLAYKIFFLSILLLASFLFGLFIYRISSNKGSSGSSGYSDSLSLGFRLIALPILMWISMSLLLKILSDEKSGLLMYLMILAAVLILTAFLYQLVKKISTYDRLERWHHNRFFTKKHLAFLMVILVLVSCFGIYQENRPGRSWPSTNSALVTKDKPNVILILIDTLRADHLSSYGYERETSPHIDRMAKEGVLFQNAVAPAPWTKPSTASLLTSRYPSVLGTIYGQSMLPDSATTLAEVLKSAGYTTAGFVANPQVKAIFNFNQGFDFYDDSIVEDKIYYNILRSRDLEKRIIRSLFKIRLSWTHNNNAEMLNRKFIPWLKENKDTNFFLYLHYIDPHEPYSPPSPFNTKYTSSGMSKNERNIALYDGEIAYIDKHIGELLHLLEELNIADNTLVILTSDHGEEFYEHGGTGHGQSLYEELIRVPLIIKYPSVLPAGNMVKNRVGIIDVMPTILEILDISSDNHMEGVSLLPLIKKENLVDRNDYFFGETYLSRFTGKSVSYRNWKYIYTESSELRNLSELGPEELYNLDDDPDELNNLLDQKPEIVRNLREKLSFYSRYVKEKAVSSPEKAKVDERTKQQLKALGYVD